MNKNSYISSIIVNYVQLRRPRAITALEYHFLFSALRFALFVVPTKLLANFAGLITIGRVSHPAHRDASGHDCFGKLATTGLVLQCLLAERMRVK